LRGLLAAALALSWIAGPSVADDNRSVSQATTAAAAYTDLLESTLTGKPVILKVVGTKGIVSFGGEKEASSSVITRIAGPSANSMRSYVNSLSERSQAAFLRDLLENWMSGAYEEEEVTDLKGKSHTIPTQEFENVDWDNASLATLKRKFGAWLSYTDDSPFSFLTPSTRKRIFLGSLEGQTENSSLQLYTDFAKWKPILGKAEDVIAGVQGQHSNIGWEVNFVPQKTYAEAQANVDWFRETLGEYDEAEETQYLFDSPGHKWLVYPDRKGRIKNDTKKLYELYRTLQMYMVLRSMEGKTGVEDAMHKYVSSDQGFEGHSTNKHLVRLENGRFGEGTLGVELRATKNPKTRGFIEQTLASRYATNDFSGLNDIDSYRMFDDLKEINPYDRIGAGYSVDEIANRFGVTRSVAKRFSDNVANSSYFDSMDMHLYPPLWRWDNVPYLSATKKALIHDLSRTFITSVADWTNTSNHDYLLDALKTWVKASNLSEDVEDYLRPKKTVSSQTIQKMLEFRPPRAGPKRKGFVDVNDIDMGNEWTARFPVRNQSAWAERQGRSGRTIRTWLENQYDLSPEERKQILEGIAKSLAKNLDPNFEPQLEFEGPGVAGGHGHSLDTAYEFRDSKGRKWRVEWDGIGRDYTEDGEIVEDSPRGGHVEVVPPKAVPTATEVIAVQKAFRENSALPSRAMGGGHVNFDLKPFEGKPRQMARMIEFFNENRGIISLMFQDPRRLRSAEAVDVSPETAAKLAHFTGSEEELKQLLYNDRYFNTRVGRKSRYVQMDVSAYFQDVIPPEFVHKDFDIKKELWRKNFDVNPKIRKGEMRLFNAPRNEIEAALQIQFAKALLHEALNGTEPLTGKVADVDYNDYLENPQKAITEMKALCKRLHLNYNDYRPMLMDSLDNVRNVLSSEFYRSYDEVIADNPRTEGWGRAVAARAPPEAIKSEDRPWDGTNKDEVAEASLKRRINERVRAKKVRAEVDTSVPEKGILRREPGLDYRIDSFDIKDVGKLRMIDRLRVIYDAKKSDAPEKRALADEALAKLKKNPDFGTILARNIVGVSDPEYRTWVTRLLTDGRYAVEPTSAREDLLRLLPRTPDLDEYAVRMLSDKSSRVRNAAKDQLSWLDYLRGKDQALFETGMKRLKELPPEARYEAISRFNLLRRNVKNSPEISRVLASSVPAKDSIKPATRCMVDRLVKKFSEEK
jgi:hypothetical protein